jgi:hypothetical protein
MAMAFGTSTFSFFYHKTFFLRFKPVACDHSFLFSIFHQFEELLQIASLHHLATVGIRSLPLFSYRFSGTRPGWILNDLIT